MLADRGPGVRILLPPGVLSSVQPSSVFNGAGGSFSRAMDALVLDMRERLCPCLWTLGLCECAM
jgi:hypothetical protein